MDNIPFTTVVLAAGSSARFKAHGLNKPKGLVRLNWRGLDGTMLEHSAQLLDRRRRDVRIAVHIKDTSMFADWVGHDSHRMKYGFYYVVSTNGQADTAQQAVDSIEGQIVIVNCDNGFQCDLNEFAAQCFHNEVNCGALVFPSSGENKYGYVDGAPWFSYGSEKNPISRFALAGAFYFRSRHVLREAYAATPFTPGKECYLSQLFTAVHGNKLAVRILRSELHEWGTPADVLNDKTVNIVDNDWYRKEVTWPAK